MTKLLLAPLPLVVLLAVAAPPSHAAAKGRCADTARGVTVLARTKTAVVFERKARTGPFKGEQFAFGCLRKRGVNVPLGVDQQDQEVAKPTLAGRYAAFGHTFCFGVEDNCGITLKIFDLQTGKRVRALDAFVDAGDVDEYLSVLKLSPTGAAVWLAGAYAVYEDPDPARQLRAVDADGVRLLDSGAGIAAKSIDLRGQTVTWKNGAETRTATLR